MANSRCPGLVGLNPFDLYLPSRTRGPLGHNDAADPNYLSHVGDTPGTLGVKDHADPCDSEFSLGLGKLRTTLSADPSHVFWDYDPKSLLNDPGLNPLFVEAARDALEGAAAAGLRPRVHQAYRSPEESGTLNKKYLAGSGGKAAPAWQSCHNYGLAMDVWLHDVKGKVIWTEKEYKRLGGIGEGCGLVWGGRFNDSDHLEYHPNWPGGAGGKLLMQFHDWAVKAAAEGGLPADWIKYFWWAAGAGGGAPAPTFLKANPVPR